MDDIVYTLYECEGESIIIRTLWNLSLSILKRKTSFLYMIFLFVDTLFPPVNKLFLSVTKFSIYFSPYISFSRLVSRPASCPSLEYHCTRHLIFNCLDSCSVGVLMFSYIVLTCCTEVCVLTARKPYCSFTQVIRVVMSIFGQSL